MQFGARLHVCARLHPGAVVPHRSLPDRRLDAGPRAPARARGSRQIRACVQFPPRHHGSGRRACRGGGARPSDGFRAAFRRTRYIPSPSFIRRCSPANYSPAPATGAMQMPGRWRAPRHSAPPRKTVFGRAVGRSRITPRPSVFRRNGLSAAAGRDFHAASCPRIRGGRCRAAAIPEPPGRRSRRARRAGRGT
jgi:hypothetical protein